MQRIPLYRQPGFYLFLLLLGWTLYRQLMLTAPDALPVSPADPDVWMRLELVRHWLLGGSWYDHTIHQSNAPYGGTVSPWTRPMDVILAVLVWFQPTAATLEHKLLTAANFYPLILAVISWFGLKRLARNIGFRELTFAPMMLALFTSIATMMRYMPGMADHHNLLSTLFIWAVACAVVLDDRASQRRAGMLFALMLWVSPEAMPLLAAMLAVQGGMWLFGKTSIRNVAQLSLACALTLALAIAIERPPELWMAFIYDSISVAYFLPVASAALLSGMLAWLEPRVSWTLSLRLFSAFVAASLWFSLQWTVDATFFQGPMAGVDPYIRTHFLPLVSEAEPLAGDHFLKIIGYYWLFVLAPFLLWFRRQNRRLLPALVIPVRYTLLLVMAVVCAMLVLVQVRFVYYFGPMMVALSLPWISVLAEYDKPWVASILPHWNQWMQPQMRRLGAFALGALFIFPAPIVLIGSGDYLKDKAKPKTEQRDSIQRGMCEARFRRYIQQGLLPLPASSAVLAAPKNIGGDIVFFTPHRIIASNYHREGLAMRELDTLMMTKNVGEFRQLIEKRQVDYAMGCLTKYDVPGVLAEALRSETPPAWLERIALPENPAPKRGMWLARIHRDRLTEAVSAEDTK